MACEPLEEKLHSNVPSSVVTTFDREVIWRTRIISSAFTHAHLRLSHSSSFHKFPPGDFSRSLKSCTKCPTLTASKDCQLHPPLLPRCPQLRESSGTKQRNTATYMVLILFCTVQLNNETTNTESATRSWSFMQHRKGGRRPLPAQQLPAAASQPAFSSARNKSQRTQTCPALSTLNSV